MDIKPTDVLMYGGIALLAYTVLKPKAGTGVMPTVPYNGNLPGTGHASTGTSFFNSPIFGQILTLGGGLATKIFGGGSSNQTVPTGGIPGQTQPIYLPPSGGISTGNGPVYTPPTGIITNPVVPGANDPIDWGSGVDWGDSEDDDSGGTDNGNNNSSFWDSSDNDGPSGSGYNDEDFMW